MLQCLLHALAQLHQPFGALVKVVERGPRLVHFSDGQEELATLLEPARGAVNGNSLEPPVSPPPIVNRVSLGNCLRTMR